jgi:hypothetical protein
LPRGKTLGAMLIATDHGEAVDPAVFDRALDPRSIISTPKCNLLRW